MELSLSDRFFKDPYYWRTVPLSEICGIYRNLLGKLEEKGQTRRVYTDKKGRKHVEVKVLDAETYD